jgi:AraC-like DNA-binding protein
MGDAAGRVDAAVGTPAAHLVPLVRRYVGYRFEGFPPGTHHGLPSHDLTVVISLGPPTRLAAMPGSDQAPAEFVTLAGGLHTRPALIAHDGDQYGVQLALTPLGARSLLGLPAAALHATVVSLDELLGFDAYELAERMALALSWPARFAVLDEVLSRRTERLDAPARELAHAWRRTGARGVVRIGDVAAAVGWSRRHLSERFAGEYGLTPKEAARVVRFERSRQLLGSGGRPALATVAADCGFYDQAHLAREWSDLAGISPSAWLAAEELPFVQDVVGAREAG